MIKKLFCIFILLSLIPGCGGGKKAKKIKGSVKKVACKDVNIPIAEDKLRSFFDDDISEFDLSEEKAEVNKDKANQSDCFKVADMKSGKEGDFYWVNADEEQKEDGLQMIHFDFDRYVIRQDQEKKLTNLEGKNLFVNVW